MIWVAGGASVVLLILAVAGLVNLIRNRDKMGTWQVVVWAVLIVLLPGIGLVAYLFWRLSHSEAMLDAIDYQQRQPGMRPGNEDVPPSSYT